MFGCLYFVKDLVVKDKMVVKGITNIFLSYFLDQKGYKRFNKHTISYFVSCDILFYESVFPYANQKMNKEPLLNGGTALLDNDVVVPSAQNLTNNNVLDDIINDNDPIDRSVPDTTSADNEIILCKTSHLT